MAAARRGKPAPISVTEVRTLIDSGTAPALLDVRSPDEFAHGHVPGAVNIPFWRVLAGASPADVSRSDPLVVYCGQGPRARMAMLALRVRGYRGVRELAGHMTEWRRLGLRESTGA